MTTEVNYSKFSSAINVYINDVKYFVRCVYIYKKNILPAKIF